jgi:uracil-DNA glycosylase family 4
MQQARQKHSEAEAAERLKKLKTVRDDVLHFKKSPLYSERVANKVHPVIGEGSHFAKIMFVGEAPGKNEAEQGRPFCGQSGRVLDELMATIGMDRTDVYVTNIVKDRPTDNRDPKPEEIELYGPFLDRQIDIIQPEIIATLGRFSMVYIMEKFGMDKEAKTPISKAHGQMFTAKSSYGKVIILPLYHPAVALYNPTTKDELKKDFQVLKKYVEES